MFWKRFHLFDLLGFPIYLDLSWFLVAVLVAWSLATGVFPDLHPELPAASLWAMGIVGAVGLFASILLHELGHAVVARRYDLPIRRITLFIFGGVAEMEREPPHPRAEFFVAVAGPAISVALGVLFLGGRALAELAGAPAPVRGVIGYLGMINLLVVVFNLVPAFPLDGGRILRSILWGWRGSLRWATRVTSGIGSGFGLVLIVLGAVTFIGGNPIAGMWYALIGLFVRNAAGMAYQQLVLRRALEGEPIERFINREPVTVSPATSLRELVDHYVYRYHHKLFPVVDGERLVGCVTTRQIKNVPPEDWDRTSVQQLVERCSPDNTVPANADAMAALARMSSGGKSRLMVVSGDRLLGVVSLKDMMGFLALKVDLEGG